MLSAASPDEGETVCPSLLIEVPSSKNDISLSLLGLQTER